METCSCDRLADMVQAAALTYVGFYIARFLLVLFGLDVALEKALDLIIKYHEWPVAGTFIIIGAWWLFWR